MRLLDDRRAQNIAITLQSMLSAMGCGHGKLCEAIVELRTDGMDEEKIEQLKQVTLRSQVRT